MKVNKITNGYVLQVFDTETKKCEHQSFVASDQVEWENLDSAYEEIEDPDGADQMYCPMDMVQPLSIRGRLEFLRQQIKDECISTGEIVELHDLVDYIDSGDTLLLEWAGVSEGSKA